MQETILIVEDDELQCHMLATLIHRKLQYEAIVAGNGREALSILDKDTLSNIRLVIMDLAMPVMSGMETLEILSQKYPGLPVIMLTGSKDINDAIKAIQRGAVDFLTKPFEHERLVLTVRNALSLNMLRKEVKRLSGEQEGKLGFHQLIGAETGLASVVRFGRKAASSDLPVLITGETGTGKEVFAKAVHGESQRAGKPFIAVNCGAIPPQLVESTLFGHEKGAFTGATSKVLGKFREAHGGTIFLDEVGELPLDAQVKLLRVLQQKEVEPVGAGRPVPVDVRIISATNRNMEEEVRAGRFREDLLFRLNVLQAEMPPLRERKKDIVPLIMHFIERFSAKTNHIAKPLSNETMKELVNYIWPGNVRQLENAIGRALVMSEGAILEPEDFSDILATDRQKTLEIEAPSGINLTANHAINLMKPDGNFKTSREIELEAIQYILKYYQGNITRASSAMGIAKSTLYKKLEQDKKNREQ
ncbi:MAG: sigma-54-dependent Fis family transcriptional regulator [Alphaproteobacteria bacterium]|nr:sigma-54-dependent Fis family transcriptional regulator [Alphaproteobacteria bacterium]